MVPKENFNEIISSTLSNKDIKAAVTDMRHFARKIFLTSFIRKQNIGLIWQIVFKLEYLFYLKGRIPLLSLKQLIKSHESIIKFLVFGKCLQLSFHTLSCTEGTDSTASSTVTNDNLRNYKNYYYYLIWLLFHYKISIKSITLH